MNYEIEIIGEPKGQPRPRAFARKMGNRYVARVYDSDTADEWKRAVSVACYHARYGATGASNASFAVRMQFGFTRPKSHFTKNGAVHPDALADHTKRPDIDNLVKAVMDAVTTTQLFWVDDSQVIELIASKKWVTGQSKCLLAIHAL